MNPFPENKKNNNTSFLELLYHVSREIAATLDLPTLLKRILALSMENIGAINGTIIALDEIGNPVASTLIINTLVIDNSGEKLKETLDNGLAGWVIKNRQAVLIPDTSKDERWLHRPDDDHNATGSKSVISAPFLTQDQLAGVITLVHPETNFFTQNHKALIQAIADQSAVAVINARLHTDTIHQARIMTALSDSATAITSSLDLKKVLQQILNQICQALDTEAASLALLDQNKESLEYYASTYKGKRNPTGMKFNLGQGIAGWVAKQEISLIVPNAYDDDRFNSKFDKLTGIKTQATACTPIFSQGEMIGILEAKNPKGGKFPLGSLRVLTGISSLAGTAIRHAQLFESHQAAHKRYRYLFEENVNSIIITDKVGKILEVNQQASSLSHYSKEKLQSMFIEMFHEVNLDILGMNFEKVTEKENVAYESVLYTKNKSKIPVTVHVQSIIIEGKPYLQWLFRDDTDRKELDKLREDLLSMIYHDLRSPLANIVSSLDVIKTMEEFEAADPTILDLFEIVIRSTNRIKRLTQSMLDINQIESGQPVIDINPTSPLKLLQESLDNLGPVIKTRRIEVYLDVPDNITPVLINEHMILRVIINLIENAIKFSPPDSTISIGVKQSTDLVRIWVKDAGPGISDENLQSIFDKFVSLQNKEGVHGYGIGLAFCRLAVEGHGGNIWAENIPGGGSQFTFTLPLYKENKI
jgi:NtrC-family two-component system sensor histidine kinase KinB